MPERRITESPAEEKGQFVVEGAPQAVSSGKSSLPSSLLSHLSQWHGVISC